MPQDDRQNGLGRRDFIKATLAGVGTVAFVGFARGEADARVAPPKKWGVETDVVVCGGGGAGYCAAIAVADAGSKAILLEKLSSPGGATAICAGGIYVAGTKLQKERGFKDGPDQYFADVMAKKSYDPPLARTMSDQGGPTIDWMMDELGLRIKNATGRFLGVEGGTGAEFQRIFEAAVKKRPKISVVLDTPVKRLIVNPNTKQVLGVETEGKKGRIAIKARKGVVLATGGYNSNMGFITKHFPEYKKVLNYGHPGNTGDGILMGQMLGGDLLHMYPRANPYIIKLGDDRGEYVRWAPFIGYGAIIVNSKAKRFIDESTKGHYVPLLGEVLGQPGETCFWIADANVWDTTMEKKVTPPWLKYGFALEGGIIKGYLEKGFIKKADTMEQLAGKLGLDPKVLQTTVDAYNKSVDAGKDSEFGRDKGLVKIEKPQFYGWQTFVGFGTTYGGLRIDTEARVIDAFGKPVPRLYGAGETTSTLWHPSGYISGTGTLRAFVFGRISGKNVAAEKPWK
jgi:flavocytochrome c